MLYHICGTIKLCDTTCSSEASAWWRYKNVRMIMIMITTINTTTICIKIN